MKKSGEEKSRLQNNSPRIFITICALVGGTSALFIYFGFFNLLGVTFTPLLLFATFVLGAILGAFFVDTGAKYLKSRLVLLTIAVFAGLVAPFCLLQILFLIFRPGDL